MPGAGFEHVCSCSEMAFSAPGLLTGEVYFQIHTDSPLHFPVPEDCTDTQIMGAAAVPSAIREKTGAHCVKAAVPTCSSLGMCLERDPASAHKRCGVDHYFFHSSPSSVSIKLPVL